MLGKHFCTVLLAATAIVGIAACATNETESEPVYAAATEAREEVICRKQRTVGSHVPKVVCRTRGQMDDERREALDSVGMLRTMGGDEPPLPSSSPPN